MSRRTRLRAPLSAILLCLFLPRPAAAAWPTDPAVNVPLCLASGGQSSPGAAPDASGGAIVAWDDQRGGPRDLYAQRVDGTGTTRWTEGGVVLCSATGEQYAPKLVADGSGGAIVAWIDARGASQDIYVQRIDSTGAPQWTPNGVAVCTATGFQNPFVIVSDGVGGAILAWQDNRTGNSKIYAQRVNAAGAPQWTANGVLLTNSLAGQARPVITSNGAGGAIVAWEDVRNGQGDIFCQRILANGALDPAWPAGGRGVTQYIGLGKQQTPAIALDGSGGAYVAWEWYGWTGQVHVQRVLASGVVDPAWPGNGRVVLAGSYAQFNPAIVSDGAGGAVVCWEDLRFADGYNRDIYAQHLLATGTIDSTWIAGGNVVCGKTGNQVFPRMIPDGAGGALVSYVDDFDNFVDTGDIAVQHMTAAGVVDSVWPDSGRALSTASRQQVVQVIVPDGAGGAVVAWQDDRSGDGDSMWDIYAQAVRGDGQLGDAPVGVPGEARFALALEAPAPNPTRTGTTFVRFTLPSDAPASLELFNVAGRRIVARDVGSLGPGRHAIEVAAGRQTVAGIYFVRLQQQGQGARVQRIVVLDE